MKKCGYGCSYWDDHAKNCNVNPKPVTERHPESIGCKFHNGPDAPIDGQLEFDTPIYLMELCRSCKHNPATSPRACGFEQIPDEETGEVIGLRCTGFEHVADPVSEHGSLCSRCERDPVNGASEPCEHEVDDIDGTCTHFSIAEGAWPCVECSRYVADEPAVGCDMGEDGLCANFEEVSEDVNQLCKSCADWVGNYDTPQQQEGLIEEPLIEHCSGKTDGSVECDDFVELPPEQEVLEEAEAVEA